MKKKLARTEFLPKCPMSAKVASAPVNARKMPARERQPVFRSVLK